jgi:hypothetical protein
VTARCPLAWAREPEAIEAMRAYCWSEKGQLGLLYPKGIPAPVAEAVDLFRATVNIVKAADWQAAADKREAERATERNSRR